MYVSWLVMQDLLLLAIPTRLVGTLLSLVFIILSVFLLVVHNKRRGNVPTKLVGTLVLLPED